MALRVIHLRRLESRRSMTRLDARLGSFHKSKHVAGSDGCSVRNPLLFPASLFAFYSSSSASARSCVSVWNMRRSGDGCGLSSGPDGTLRGGECAADDTVPNDQ